MGNPVRDHRRAAVTFRAEAGQDYVVKTDESLEIWVVEERTGERIASRESRTGPKCVNHSHSLEAQRRDVCAVSPD